jgi:hypothetical protein
MTQQQFHSLARQIIRHEQTEDVVRRVYWFKQFARLVSLCRNSNLYGG